MANLKGGYQILDLGKILIIENGTIADDTQFSTNYNGKQLKRILIELSKTMKPVLLKYKWYDAEIIEYVKLTNSSNDIIFQFSEYIGVSEELTIDVFQVKRISYYKNQDELSFENIDY